MEEIILYLAKANSLLAIFFLAYYFLIQKVTFFNQNRWFLLSGLLTSALLPLVFITKIVYVEKNPILDTRIANTVSITNVTQQIIEWNFIVFVAYSTISLILFAIIVSNLFSLFKLLKSKKIELQKPFAMVNIDEKINPFSFFKYIVFNSTLYSETELKNILNHEKVHSREKHSVDVLIARIFCALFWFNPFVWWYKNAILQNLEFIADQKAIQDIDDKKAYQMTLLRVVTDHNCLPITNNFNQSLIKKRIVMLNKNESQKSNSWKYFLVIPVVVAFIFLFQIRVEAREKQNDVLHSKNSTDQVIEVIITKNSTDKELKSDCEQVKKQANVDLKVSKVKRNSRGEITRIRVAYDDNNGSASVHDVASDEPITSFKFSIKKLKNGKGEVGFYDISDQSTDSDNENYLVENTDMPVPPTPPTQSYTDKMPAPPTLPNFPSIPNIKTPNDPNDAVGWKKFEEEMEKFAKAWETTEMKKYEADMEEYGRKMEALQPEMSEFEAKMEEFESKMEAFQDRIEAYQNKIHEDTQARRDEITAKRDRKTARSDSETAKRDSEAAKRDALNSRK